MKILLIFVIFTAFESGQLQSTDPNVLCSTRPGRLYEYGTTCIQYLKCHLYGGTMLGAIYECMGTTRFNPVLAYCQDGYVCNSLTTTTVSSTSASSTSTISTLSTTSTVTPSTTPAPFNANAFCNQKAYGYYPYPTGCLNYIYCYPYGGVMLGQVYTCMGTTRFNPALSYCVDGFTC